MTSWFDFYGIGVELNSTDPMISEWIGRDFKYFSRKSRPLVKKLISIDCQHRAFPFERRPYLKSKSIGPRCTTYKDAKFTWVDYYSGQCMVRWNFSEESGEIWSADAHLLYEVCYLLILSRTGEWLDYQGIHRLHASAVATNGRATLVVMPSGGGKSTLAMGLMSEPSIEFMSDDMPLVQSDGEVLAFPSRLGLLALPTEMQNPKYARQVHRREHGSKWLVDADIYNDRIAGRAHVRTLIFGSRKLNGAPNIYRASRIKAFKMLIASLVVGVGIPQLVEYFLRLDWRDNLTKVPLVFSRLKCAFLLSIRAQAFEFELGVDPKENVAALKQFLRDRDMSDAK